MSSNAIKEIFPDMKTEYAWRLLRARFPNWREAKISAEQCVDLMKEFAEFETRRADVMEQIAKETLDSRNKPVVILKEQR